MNTVASVPAAASGSLLGTEVRDRRTRLGLSVRALAQHACVSPAYITAIETAHNPSTGRPPVPSLAIVTRLAAALGLDLETLAQPGLQPDTGHSPHVLAYVLRSPVGGILATLDALLGADVDHWLHIADPRSMDDDDPARATTRRFELGAYPYETRHLEPAALLDAVEREVAALAPEQRGRRVGLLIADCSAVMRYLQNAFTEIELESSWHQRVHEIWTKHLGAPPAVDVCAYNNEDIEVLGLTIDQLATALELITHHDHVIVLDGDAATTNAPAIRRILGHARPIGTSADAWQTLTAAAAQTLATPNGPERHRAARTAMRSKSPATNQNKTLSR